MSTTKENYQALKKVETAALQATFKRLVSMQEFRSCINCESWNDTDQRCSHFNMRPPAKVIVFSCGDAWLGEIPF